MPGYNFPQFIPDQSHDVRHQSFALPRFDVLISQRVPQCFGLDHFVAMWFVELALAFGCFSCEWEWFGCLDFFAPRFVVAFAFTTFVVGSGFVGARVGFVGGGTGRRRGVGGGALGVFGAHFVLKWYPTGKKEMDENKQHHSIGGFLCDLLQALSHKHS